MTINTDHPFLSESQATLLPTEWGLFKVSAFGYEPNSNHLLLMYGDVQPNDIPLVRIHSECITSEVFGSLKCDCKSQLTESIDLIKAEGKGIIIYLRQEGRGIGLFKKIEAYRLQELGFNTIDANLELDLPVDKRDYHLAYLILKKKDIHSIRLITNNEDKVGQIRKYGLKVCGVVHTSRHYNSVNDQYINTKIASLGHKYLNYDQPSVTH